MGRAHPGPTAPIPQRVASTRLRAPPRSPSSRTVPEAPAQCGKRVLPESHWRIAGRKHGMGTTGLHSVLTPTPAHIAQCRCKSAAHPSSRSSTVLAKRLTTCAATTPPHCTLRVTVQHGGGATHGRCRNCNGQRRWTGITTVPPPPLPAIHAPAKCLVPPCSRTVPLGCFPVRQQGSPCPSSQATDNGGKIQVTPVRVWRDRSSHEIERRRLPTNSSVPATATRGVSTRSFQWQCVATTSNRTQ